MKSCTIRPKLLVPCFNANNVGPVNSTNSANTPATDMLMSLNTLMPLVRPRNTLYAKSATASSTTAYSSMAVCSMPNSSATQAASIGVASPSDVPVPPTRAMMKMKSTIRPSGRLAMSSPNRPVSAVESLR